MLSAAPDLSIHKATERKRRLVHFAFGACALLIEPLGRSGSAALAAAALLYNALLAPALGLDRGYRRAADSRTIAVGWVATGPFGARPVRGGTSDRRAAARRRGPA